ncbi:MAG: PEP-CTERM sorting domain-containing protein, partial [Planctomycetaceae bacterium]|nr:PEP-CTERM sorting domain-containing protein [Planctomycetaceae bacterium]
STLAGDMQNNGGFQVDTGSGLLFLDDLSGTGPFTGGGEVTFQGGLNPGNSPGTIEFGGDVTLGATSLTTIEIAGLDTADFDRLLLNNVDALLTIENGAGLDVQLINGFSLGFNQEFIFADVAGSNAVAGTFSGLGEGDLVGNFGGFDLFISYGAGTGNDISFFTSVPEPGALVMFGLVVGLGGMGRRRRRRTA